MAALLFFVLLQVLITPIFLKSMPSFVPLCKRNDPELEKCFIHSVNNIRPYLIKGIPEMELPPIEPLQYYDLAASSDGGSVKLSAKSWNQTAFGIKDFEIKTINLDFENARCNTTVFFPSIQLKGKYSFKGTLFLLEIDTSGDFEVNTTNLLAHAEFFGKYYSKSTEEYIEFHQIDLRLDIGDSKVLFENLVNGNKDLSVSLNQAINENIGSIVDEIRPVIEQTFAGIIQLYFNTVFRLYSIDTLFPKD